MPSIVPLMAALVTLVLTPGWLSHFDVTPKIVILLFGTMLILCYPGTNLHNIYKLLGSRFGRGFAIVLLAQWIALCAATALSMNAPLSLHGGSWRRFGFITETALLLFALLAAAWLAADGQNVRQLLRVNAGCTALASVYGIVQYFGLDPLLPAQAYQVGEGAFRIVRPPGPLGHADYFGAWLVVAFFFVVALRKLETGGRVRALLAVVLALNAVALLFTGTRSAILGLVAGALLLGFLERRTLGWRAVAGGIACAAALAVFIATPAGAKLRARGQWSAEDALGGARLLLWRDAARMAVTHAAAGFGPETFATEFPHFESRELARAYPDFYHESPHNLFLDSFTAEGVAGVAALFALCLLGLFAGTRGIRAGDALSPSLTSALVGALVAQQFIVFVLPTAMYFYLAIALLVARAGPAEERACEPGKAWIWVTRALSLAASVVFATFSLHLVMTDAALERAQKRIMALDASGAAQAYQQALSWQVPGASFDLEYSRAMQQVGARSPVPAIRFLARQQAVEAGFRAASTSENQQNAWYNLAILLASNQDATGVERALRNAIAASPYWFKPHWALARFLAESGKHDEALREAREALDLDGGHDAEVAETWKQLSAIR